MSIQKINERRHRGFLLPLLLIYGVLAVSSVHAEDMPAYTLNIKDGRFYPETINVPSQTRFKIVITNAGPGPEEFESTELRKEKVLAPGVTRALVFAPLKPGIYRFFGEFNPDTAQGRIIVK